MNTRVEKADYITIYMLADYDFGEVVNKEPHKLERWEWFSWNNLPQPLFIPMQNLLKTDFHPFSNNKKYQHYKGNFYELVGEGRHSDTLEEYVVYKGLYDSKEFGKNPVWVKSKEEFFKSMNIDGKEIPRFKFIEKP